MLLVLFLDFYTVKKYLLNIYFMPGLARNKTQLLLLWT